METNAPHRIAIYSRKSKFTGKGESIGNQIEMCKNYIRLHYPGFSEEDILVYEDEGYSGKNTQRPQFKKMMNDGKHHKFDAVVCYRLDRVSRNIKDFAELIQELQQLNISFVSINEQFDTSSPIGRAMMFICSVFSQLERETIAERIRDNMRELAKSGRWLGGTTPTGYKSKELVGSVTVDGKVRKAFKLDIIKEEAELVKLIFDKFIETNSLTKTEIYLRQQHIKTKNNRDFSRFSISNILRNPVYMIADKEAWNYFECLGVELFSEESAFDGVHGIMAYSKTIQTTGKSNQLKDVKDWIIAVGKHKGLISGAQWVQVQRMLDQNKSKSYHKPKSNVALLSGLLFCGNCGAYMRPKLSSRLNANGERIYDYLCETKEKTRSQDCKMKRPNGNELDRLVCEQIKALSEDHSKFLKELEQARKSLEEHQGDFDQRLDELKRTQKETERKIQSLVETLADTAGSAAKYITEQINELDKENESLKEQIENMENLTMGQSLTDLEFDILKEMLKNFSSSFDTMSVEQKRSALRSFVKRIVWDGETVHIFLFGADDKGIDFSNPASETEEPQGEDFKCNKYDS